MNRIRSISFVLRMIFTLAFIVLPVYTTLFWISTGHPFGPQYTLTVFPYSGPNLPLLDYLPIKLKVYGYFINLIPIVIDMAILFILIRLFRRFEKGSIFTISNVKRIRRIGWLMLIGEIIQPFYALLLSFTMTYANPPGFRFAYLGVNLQNVTLAVVAMLIILVSWIIQEGHKINEENSLTV